MAEEFIENVVRDEGDEVPTKGRACKHSGDGVVKGGELGDEAVQELRGEEE